jgi:copper transport protein
MSARIRLNRASDAIPEAPRIFELMRPRSLGISLLLTTVLMAGVFSAAHAHARLLRSSPEDGAVLPEAPPQIFLWFDEPTAVEFSSVELLDTSAQPVGGVTLRGDASDPTLVVVTLPSLPEGVYSLAWKVLSNTDSHFTQGTLVYGVGQVEAVVPRSPAETEVSIPPAEVALSTLNYAALAALVGSLLVGAVVLPEGQAAPEALTAISGARSRVRWLGVGAALLGVIVGLGGLGWQATVVGRGLVELLGTRFGGLWLARESAWFVALIGGGLAGRAPHWGLRVAGLAAVALVGIQALSGHAAGLSDQTALAIVMVGLHLLAAGVWVGSLLALLVGLLPLLLSRRDEWREAAAGGWKRFGVVAALSVGALAITGLYSAGRQVASLDAWLVTLYGQVLAGKVGLFLVVGLVGLCNSMLLHPRLTEIIGAVLRRPTGWLPFNRDRLPLVLLAEAGLAVFLFAASALLTAAPPARGPEFEPRPATQKPPSSLALPADDLLVNLQIRPNKPGLNLLVVNPLNTRRPPPAEFLRVIVRLTYVERDLGTQSLILEPQDDGLYRLSSSALSLPGRWRVQVVVRRSGIEDSVANFDWQVEPLAPAAPPRPVIVSNAPIGSTLSLLAAAIAVGIAATALGFRLRRGHPS